MGCQTLGYAVSVLPKSGFGQPDSTWPVFAKFPLLLKKQSIGRVLNNKPKTQKVFVMIYIYEKKVGRRHIGRIIKLGLLQAPKMLYVTYRLHIAHRLL